MGGELCGAGGAAFCLFRCALWRLQQAVRQALVQLARISRWTPEAHGSQRSVCGVMRHARKGCSEAKAGLKKCYGAVLYAR